MVGSSTSAGLRRDPTGAGIEKRKQPVRSMSCKIDAGQYVAGFETKSRISTRMNCRDDSGVMRGVVCLLEPVKI